MDLTERIKRANGLLVPKKLPRGSTNSEPGAVATGLN